MTYRVRVDPLAQREIDQFAVYLRAYDEEFAIEQIERLDRILHTHLAESPLTWASSRSRERHIAPTCSRVGRRTQYWIVYTVHEETRTVDILSFWNTARDPDTLDV